MYDRAEISIKAGDGGRGIAGFRREKFVPLGGPDGGDGGDGGDVIIRADNNVTGLQEYTSRRRFKAENGHEGSGKKKYGKKGADLILSVPVGTMVLNKTTTGASSVVADLNEPGQQVTIAKGGRGGMGNVHFASSTNQVPMLAQKGEKGEEKELLLELKLLADVGIVGYPNAGKSTLISLVSAARPKVASYPFTTLEPVLGVVDMGNTTFIIAEIPGIVEDAHLGKGLGHDFLRHVERTRVLVHLVDGGAIDPAEDVAKVNMELALFDSALAKKPQIVVVNKIDLPEVKARKKEITGDFKSVGISPLFISAQTGEGISGLLARTMEILAERPTTTVTSADTATKIFHPQPRRAHARVEKKGDGFVVLAPDIERIVEGSEVTNPEVLRQFIGLLTRYRITRALELAGVKPGDIVRCGSLEWKW